MALTTEQLIDAALRQQLIQASVLANMRVESRRRRVDLLEALTAYYRFPISAFYRAVADVRGLPFTDNIQTVNQELLKKIPQVLIRRKGLLPILEDANGVLLAISDPEDHASIETIQRILEREIKLVVAEPKVLNFAINKAYAASTNPINGALALAQKTSPDVKTNTAPPEVDLVSLLDSIFQEAFLRRASDIHLMQDAVGLRVRLRVDGKLQEHVGNFVNDVSVAKGLMSRIKVLSNLDIAEQREPQDGGMTYYLPPPIDTEFNVRIATAPTTAGERITMRVLGQDEKNLTLDKIGISEPDLVRFRKAIRKPFGMILITGPTGSGKSTTVFAALNEISTPELNILTVENPVEYEMDGISQVQTTSKVTFASALRSLLRHDPDVLMVGEIRDEETGDVALKAAMTGHLVFSTLHTNTAVGTITRLVDIGIEPFLIGTTMNAVIAQRLVRRLCPHCKTSRPATAEEKQLLNVNNPEEVLLHEPKGCAYCQGTGYRGRLGLFETLWFDDELRQLVGKGCTEEELEIRAGDRLKPMWIDGCAKVLDGTTSLKELQTVATRGD